jgi:hypothetical protein
MNDIEIWMEEERREVPPFERSLIQQMDQNIQRCIDFICYHEEGFHISCGVVSSILMISLFGSIF